MVRAAGPAVRSPFPTIWLCETGQRCRSPRRGMVVADEADEASPRSKASERTSNTDTAAIIATAERLCAVKRERER